MEAYLPIMLKSCKKKLFSASVAFGPFRRVCPGEMPGPDTCRDAYGAGRAVFRGVPRRKPARPRLPYRRFCGCGLSEKSPEYRMGSGDLQSNAVTE